MADEIMSLEVIEKSVDVFLGMKGVLVDHQTRSAKALHNAGVLEKKWEEAFSIDNAEAKRSALAEVDALSNQFLVKCNQVKTTLQENRKPATALMDTFKELFTIEENKLDIKKSAGPAKIQEYRNNYAKWRMEEQKRIDKEAEDRVNLQKERADINAEYKKSISTWLLNFLSAKKMSLATSFNSITLDNYEEKKTNLAKMPTTFPIEKLALIRPNVIKRYHTEEEVEAIWNDVVSGYDLEGFYSQYQKEIEAAKKKMIDELPSKKQELDEAEAARKREEDARIRRQAEIDKAKGDAEKDRLRLKAEQEEKEAAREKLRLETEQLNREIEERKKLADEAEQAKKDAEDKAELERAAQTAAAQFDQITETAVLGSQPAAKMVFVITILHPAGMIELIQFWYTREGAKLSIEDLEKKTFKQIKTFCEKAAKEGEMIESKFLRYTEDAKALNKK